MTVDEGKSRGFVAGHQHESHPPPPPSDQPPHLPPAPQYGTFQGVPNPSYPPQHPHQPAMGFPQPAPPPGAGDPSAPPPYGQYYTQGYQSVPVEGYAVAEGRPVHERRLPCCGLGLGWCLFIIGFFLGGIPWYVGAILLMCARGRLDYREKPGYIVCAIAAILETVGIIVGSTSRDW